MKKEKIFISFVLCTIVLNLVSCTNLNTNSKQTTGFDTQEVEDMETKNLSGVIPDKLETASNTARNVKQVNLSNMGILYL